MNKKCSKCGVVKSVDEFYKVNGLHLNQCKKCKLLTDKIYSQTPKGKLKQKRADFKRRYGITLDSVDEMISNQDSCCDVCGIHGSESILVVDHNHETGSVRSILCKTCNTGIGMFQDNPHLLRQAAKYIERHRKAG